MPLFGGGRRRPPAQVRAYNPNWAEYLGQQAGNALSPVLGDRGGVRFGNRVGSFLSAFTPVGNLDGILYGDNTERQLSALPLPGPARKVVKQGVNAFTGKVAANGNRLLKTEAPNGQTNWRELKASAWHAREALTGQQEPFEMSDDEIAYWVARARQRGPIPDNARTPPPPPTKWWE